MIYRRKLSDAVLAAVTAGTGYPVRDAQPPDANFGWSGTPGDVGSTFTPYSILTPLSGSNSSGPLSDTQADWLLGYSLSSFGTSRSQCEWIADLARASLQSLVRTTFDGVDSTYTILQARIDAIGGIVRSDAVNPPLFGQTDSIAIRVTKGT